MNAAIGSLRDVNVEPVLLYAVKETLDPTTWRVGEHHHAHHELLIFQRGQQCTRMGDQEIVASPGEAFFFSAGTPHEEWLIPDSTVVKYTLGFDWDVDLSLLPARLSDSCGRLTEMAEWISAEFEDRGDNHPPIVEPHVYGLVGELRRAANRASADLVSRARAALRREMDCILRVEDLAKVLGMSRSHLSRRLSEEAGICPTTFLREERLRRAKHLLGTTQMGVKEIASTIGVSSEQQLCRMIRQAYGKTTREMRGLTNARAYCS